MNKSKSTLVVSGPRCCFVNPWAHDNNVLTHLCCEGTHWRRGLTLPRWTACGQSGASHSAGARNPPLQRQPVRDATGYRYRLSPCPRTGLWRCSLQSSGTPEPPTEPRGASGVHRRARVLFPWSADPIAEHTAECRLCSELAALQ